MKGRGLAVMGLILGYIQVLGTVLLGILLILGVGFALFVAAESEVDVQGEKVVVTGPLGSKIEVDDTSEKVHIVAPGTEVKVDGERVIVRSPGGEVRVDGEDVVVKGDGAEFRTEGEDVIVTGSDGSKVKIGEKHGHGRRFGKKPREARKNIEELAAALVNFRLDVGRFPSKEEGLSALAERPAGAEGWSGPYVKQITRDPWGKPFQYELSGGQEGRFSVYSLGQDGVRSKDDVR
jgi:type II secretion system protein G